MSGLGHRLKWMILGQRKGEGLLRWWLIGVTAMAVAIGVQTQKINRNTARAQHNTAILRALQRTQGAALRGSCDRTNTLRFNDNRNAAGLYLTLRLVTRLTHGPTKREAVRIKVVLGRLTQTNPDTAQALATLIQPQRDVSRRFANLADKLRFIPETNCPLAVGTPLQFLPPTPVPIRSLTPKQVEHMRRTGKP